MHHGEAQSWLWSIPYSAWNATIGLIKSNSQQVHIDLPKAFTFDDFTGIFQGSPWIKFAAISGGTAVALSAYYAHKMTNAEQSKKEIFATGLQQHYYHTLALLMTPMVPRQHMTASLFFSGIIMFCGSCYATSVLGVEDTKRIAPFGNFAFVLGWLSIII